MMGYFQDVLDLIFLREETYKKIGNDRNAFKRFTLVFFVNHYVIMLFWALLLSIGINFLAPKAFSLVMSHPFIFLGLFLIYPFTVYISSLIFLLIPYVIGLLCGGRPRSFFDFVKVVMYDYPVILPLSMFPSVGPVISMLHLIWSFPMLFKTYKVIHRLSSRAAWGALTVNIILWVLFILAVAVLFFWFVSQSPELAAQLLQKP